MNIEEIKASLGMGKSEKNTTNEKETEIHSEIYGINKGHVFEKNTGTDEGKKK